MPASPPKTNSRKPYLIALLLIAALGIGVVVYSFGDWTASAKAKKLRNPVAPTPTTIDAGMQVYMQHCARCHGIRGDGKGDKTDQLSVAPADFGDAHKMSSVTDGELYWQITKGKDPMPSYEDSLNETQRWQTVDYIRQFAAKSR